MPGVCVSLWQTDECRWSVEYFWRWSDYVERGIFLALAFMLAYTFFVLIRFLRRCLLAHLESRKFQSEPSPDFLARKRAFLADLSRGLRTLNGIGSAAPFLGLAGTAYLILDELSRGFSMSRSSLLYYLTTGTASTLFSTVAGIIVAVPAITIHNVLRSRVEAMQRELSVTSPSQIERSFRRAQSLPLRRRFSGLPAFALIAVPVFACTVAVFMWAPSDRANGLAVALPPFPCHPVGSDRIILVRITNAGELFINMEPLPWARLSDRLTEIYRMRASCEIDLYAEDDVPFQTVADAIDIARNSPGPGPDSLKIKVILVTPKATQKCVPIPVRIIPKNQALR